MIPQLVSMSHRRPNGRWLRLYIPVVPVALVLSPLLLLAILAGLVACLVFEVNPLGAVRGSGRLLWALPGTRIEMDDGQWGLRISVR
jgi:hypothetical protein